VLVYKSEHMYNSLGDAQICPTCSCASGSCALLEVEQQATTCHISMIISGVTELRCDQLVHHGVYATPNAVWV